MSDEKVKKLTFAAAFAPLRTHLETPVFLGIDKRSLQGRAITMFDDQQTDGVLLLDLENGGAVMYCDDASNANWLAASVEELAISAG
jgi:hypothetical protein